MGVNPVWGLGAAAVGLFAFLFPDWRIYHVATSAPLLLILLLTCVSPPDSLPWLMVNGKHEQAKA